MSCAGPRRSGESEVKAGTCSDLRINQSSWRQEGHKLHPGDSSDVISIIEASPEGGDVCPNFTVLEQIKTGKMGRTEPGVHSPGPVRLWDGEQQTGFKNEAGVEEK